MVDAMNVYLTGPAGSGKDTAARALLESWVGGMIPRCAWLPIHVVAALDMDDSRRRALQFAGDALRNAFGDDFLARWVADASDDYPAQNAVCPDVRLPAEGAYLRSRGWIGLRIERDEVSRQAELVRRGEDPATMAHHTETSYRDVPVDGIVYNAGTEEDLAATVVDMVRAIARQREHAS